MSRQGEAALTGEAVFYLAAVEVFRDGVVDPDENRMLQQLLRLLGIPRDRALHISQLARARAGRDEVVGHAPARPEAVVRAACRRALADGVVEPEEARLLDVLAQTLGVPLQLVAAELSGGARAPEAASPRLPFPPGGEPPPGLAPIAEEDGAWRRWRFPYPGAIQAEVRRLWAPIRAGTVKAFSSDPAERLDAEVEAWLRAASAWRRHGCAWASFQGQVHALCEETGARRGFWRGPDLEPLGRDHVRGGLTRRQLFPFDAAGPTSMLFFLTGYDPQRELRALPLLFDPARGEDAWVALRARGPRPAMKGFVSRLTAGPRPGTLGVVEEHDVSGHYSDDYIMREFGFVLDPAAGTFEAWSGSLDGPPPSPGVVPVQRETRIPPGCRLHWERGPQGRPRTEVRPLEGDAPPATASLPFEVAAEPRSFYLKSRRDADALLVLEHLSSPEGSTLWRTPAPAPG